MVKDRTTERTRRKVKECWDANRGRNRERHSVTRSISQSISVLSPSGVSSFQLVTDRYKN